MALNNASYSFSCTVKQANNQPYDLTGKSLVMGFKNSTGPTGTGFTTIQTSDNSIAVQSPATNGIFVGTLSKLQMAAMAQGTWYWDMLDITNSDLPIAMGAGILLVQQGITQSATPVTPSPGLLMPGFSDSISVVMPGDSIVLTMAPQGPPGTGASFAPQSVPSAPAEGFLVYCDSADGLLKAISSNGNITDLALP
ncbi:MAG TPA: hypothetical protein VKR31_00900 [Rhizomicrobium sp.]|nr:hypothetical protein [Rhizomicrobium sp.]